MSIELTPVGPPWAQAVIQIVVGVGALASIAGPFVKSVKVGKVLHVLASIGLDVTKAGRAMGWIARGGED